MTAVAFSCIFREPGRLPCPCFPCPWVAVAWCPAADPRCLLALGWNELLIASFSHRSIDVRDGILLATGLHVHRNSAHSAGVGAIFDRSVALGQAGLWLEGVEL